MFSSLFPQISKRGQVFTIVAMAGKLVRKENFSN